MFASWPWPAGWLGLTLLLQPSVENPLPSGLSFLAFAWHFQVLPFVSVWIRGIKAAESSLCQAPDLTMHLKLPGMVEGAQPTSLEGCSEMLSTERRARLIYVYSGVLYFSFRGLYHEILNPRWEMIVNILRLAVIWDWDTCVRTLNPNRMAVASLARGTDRFIF